MRKREVERGRKGERMAVRRAGEGETKRRKGGRKKTGRDG